MLVIWDRYRVHYDVTVMPGSGDLRLKLTHVSKKAKSTSLAPGRYECSKYEQILSW